MGSQRISLPVSFLPLINIDLFPKLLIGWGGLTSGEPSFRSGVIVGCPLFSLLNKPLPIYLLVIIMSFSSFTSIIELSQNKNYIIKK